MSKKQIAAYCCLIAGTILTGFMDFAAVFYLAALVLACMGLAEVYKEHKSKKEAEKSGKVS